MLLVMVFIAYLVCRLSAFGNRVGKDFSKFVLKFMVLCHITGSTEVVVFMLHGV